MTKVLWIGLAEVRSLGESQIVAPEEAAYVQVVALAADGDDFERAVRARFLRDNLTLTSLDEIETVEDRKASGTISEPLLARVSEVDEDRPVLLHTFHVFDLEE